MEALLPTLLTLGSWAVRLIDAVAKRDNEINQSEIESKSYTEEPIALTHRFITYGQTNTTKPISSCLFHSTNPSHVLILSPIGSFL